MVDTANDITDPADTEDLTSVDVTIAGAKPEIVSDISWIQCVLAESILTPGLQTSIKIQNNSNFIPIKNFDTIKGLPLNLRITRPSLKKYGLKEEMKVSQTIYRMGGRSATIPNAQDNRKQINRAVEELTLHACDPTLLNDASSLVSKSWKCDTPSRVSEEVLRQCAGVKNLIVEPSEPARPFVAENKHPFQVVMQQANVALASGEDPSFLHFMTFEKAEEGQGTHHFRSLKKMTTQKPSIDLVYDESSAYSNPKSIMSYMFPCDFDLLTDILNGVGSETPLISSLALFNPALGNFSLFGNQNSECGIGGGSYKMAITNQGSETNEYSCPDNVSKYLQKRQARMALVEKDKIAVRIIVPWNPIYNVGKMISVNIYSPEEYEGENTNQPKRTPKYGSGDYLIVALVHNIVAGGYSTITLDCVSETVGKGIV